jgi:hypothetical protein
MLLAWKMESVVKVFQNLSRKKCLWLAMAILFTLDLMTATVMKYMISLQTTNGLSHTIQMFYLGLIILFIITPVWKYSPFSLRYDAHINLECVMSLTTTKYITKYTHKGLDCATVQLQQRDKVLEYKDSWYIATFEANWWLFEFVIHHQDPAVMSLQIHLPGQHMVVFKPSEPIETVTMRAQQECTMLTVFFDLNKKDKDTHQFTYQELPMHYIWDRQTKLWRSCWHGLAIGHVYFVLPTAGERFYL